MVASPTGAIWRVIQKSMSLKYEPNSTPYRGTSLIKNCPLLGPYSRPVPRALWWSWGGVAISYESGTPAGCAVTVE